MLSGLFRASVLGRSANMAPFWIKAWWARKRSDKETWGLDQKWNEMIVPCLAWRSQIIGSSSENDFRSQKMSEMIGK
jgi:hypothetical protein